MSAPIRRLSTHRLLQVAEMADRASHERVAYYCRAIKATSIGNSGAALYFTTRAQKWERIRVAADRQLCGDLAIAKAEVDHEEMMAALNEEAKR